MKKCNVLFPCLLAMVVSAIPQDCSAGKISLRSSAQNGSSVRVNVHQRGNGLTEVNACADQGGIIDADLYTSGTDGGYAQNRMTLHSIGGVASSRSVSIARGRGAVSIADNVVATHRGRAYLDVTSEADRYGITEVTGVSSSSGGGTSVLRLRGYAREALGRPGSVLIQGQADSLGRYSMSEVDVFAEGLGGRNHIRAVDFD